MPARRQRGQQRNTSDGGVDLAKQDTTDDMSGGTNPLTALLPDGATSLTFREQIALTIYMRRICDAPLQLRHGTNLRGFAHESFTAADEWLATLDYERLQKRDD